MSVSFVSTPSLVEIGSLGPENEFCTLLGTVISKTSQLKSTKKKGKSVRPPHIGEGLISTR